MTERSERMNEEGAQDNQHPTFSAYTPKPVYTPLALRDWSGAAPEPAMAKNQMRLAGGCAHCVITTTSAKLVRHF